MNKRALIGIGVAFAAIAVGVGVGYKLATDAGLRGKIVRAFTDVVDASRSKVGDMSEEVAARAAQVTRNPQVNQEWVAQQWEKMGY